MDVSIIDENIEDLDLNEECDLVGITAVTANVNRAYKIADEFRKRDKKVVMGGAHVSFIPDEALNHADSVVIGEAEGCWENLLNDFKKGILKRKYKSNKLADLSNYKPPRVDLLKLDRYACPHIVETGRGCPYNCAFCSVTNQYGKTYRFRSIDSVVEEIKSRNANLIIFMDDNIFSNPKRAKELFKALIPLKIDWFAQSSIRIGKDEEALGLAKKSGCGLLLIGLESLSKQNLEDSNKKINVASDYKKCIKNMHKYNVPILGSFVFGFDNDNASAIEKTVEFAIDNKLETVHFTCLTPIPGSDLFKRMKSENRLIEKNWDKYDFCNIVYSSKNLAQNQIITKIKKSLQEFYSFKSIYKRIRFFPLTRDRTRMLIINFYYHFKYKALDRSITHSLFINSILTKIMKITKIV